MHLLGDVLSYSEWASNYASLPTADLALIREHLAATTVSDGSGPLFTLAVAAHAAGSGPSAVRAAQSVVAQLHQSWEAFFPQSLAASVADPRISGLAGGILDLAACNEVLARAGGKYLIVLVPGAMLAPHALCEVAYAIESTPEPAVIYTDSDHLDAAGSRTEPQFRTGWDPDLLLGCLDLGPAVAIQVTAARAAGGFRDCGGIELAVVDLVLRIATAVPPSRICHIPAVLSHRSNPYQARRAPDYGAACALVRRHLNETGHPNATIRTAPLLPTCIRVGWPIQPGAPLVSIIVPTRDRADLLATCAEGILKRTDYAPLELLIVDNGSANAAAIALFEELRQDTRVRILSHPGPFNYPAINNRAVGEARGEVIVLLNDDTQVIGAEWLTELVSQALRPDVGAVGARLLYGDGSIQHCGVTLGPGWTLSHQLRRADRLDPGPGGALALVRTVSAVTGACIAMRKSVFLEVGGLDEDRFRVAFNDIDLCLRLGDFGYRVICTPFAELFHLESVTRGSDDTPEKLQVAIDEGQRFRKLWDPLLDSDPFHNPNIVFRWPDTILAEPPRRERPWRQARSIRPGDQAGGESTAAGWSGECQVIEEEPNGQSASGATPTEAILRDRAVRRAVEARQYAAALQERLDRNDQELLSLRQHLADVTDALHETTAALQQSMAALEQMAADRDGWRELHRQVTRSTTWKASWPLRGAAGIIPPAVRGQLRQGLTQVWASFRFLRTK